jgi:hypothetical protein
METRHISLSLPAEEWAALLGEIDQREQEDRFRCSLSDHSENPLATARVGELIARGYSWGERGGGLVPRPAGVLHIASSLAAHEDMATWISHMPAQSFRQHVVAVDIGGAAFARFSPPSGAESWHLSALMHRGGWAQFIMEFIASREIDVVQIIAACFGADLVPALRAAYPSIRVVVDTGGEGVSDDAWLTYVTSRYGNVIDAFCTPQSAAAATLRSSGVSASRIHTWSAEHGDEAAAAAHAHAYAGLLAGSVG